MRNVNLLFSGFVSSIWTIFVQDSVRAWIFDARFTWGIYYEGRLICAEIQQYWKRQAEFTSDYAVRNVR